MKRDKNIRKNKSYHISIAVFFLIASSLVIFRIDYITRFEAKKAEAAYAFSQFISDLRTSFSIPASIANQIKLGNIYDQAQLEKHYYTLSSYYDPEFIPDYLQLAPDGIVTYEAPYTGGPHIGHDLFADPNRRLEALAAVESSSEVIAGPLKLIQGDTALIVRYPVNINFNTKNPKIWGLSIAIYYWDSMDEKLARIANSLGVDLQVYISTLSATKMVYPTIVDVDLLPTALFESKLGLGKISFTFDIPYYPSKGAILGFITFSLIFLTGYGIVITSAEKSRKQKDSEVARFAAESLLEAGTAAYTVVNEKFERVLISDRAREIFDDNISSSKFLSMYRNLDENQQDSEKYKLSSLKTDEVYYSPLIHEFVKSDKKIIYIRRNARWFKNPFGDGRLLWNGFDDVTELVEAKNKLEVIAYTDHLTKLKSRRALNRDYIDGARPHDYGLFIIDLDFFKSINDSFGHDAGDEYLKGVANSLVSLADDASSAIRLGGEEFAIVRPWESWQKASEFAETIRSTVRDTVVVFEGRSIQRTVSIGVAQLKKDESLSNCMRLGDMALIEAKNVGRDTYVIADDVFRQTLGSEGKFITDIEVQSALFDGNIFYYVQPIWDVVHGKIIGFEALIRWSRLDGSFVPPPHFVDVLRNVMRDDLNRRRVIELAACALLSLSDYPDAFVSFNFSLGELSYEGAADELVEVFAQIRDVPKRKIMIELSEEALTSRFDKDVLKLELKKLRQHGFLIALDDFGANHSNLDRLQELPIDIVKLDKSLINDVEKNHFQKAAIRGISATLRSLQIPIVAEGVETVNQANILFESQVTLHQGYLHAPPLPPEQIGCALTDIGKAFRDQRSKKYRADWS